MEWALEKPFDKDVEEEEIRVWDGEKKEEVTCVGRGLEVEEPVGKFGNG